ncbi:MAG: hypothetical protein AAGA68_21080 [Pseudomonadota bacterium]
MIKKNTRSNGLRSAVANAIGATAAGLIALPASASVFLFGDTISAELTIGGETVTSDIELAGYGTVTGGLDGVSVGGGEVIGSRLFFGAGPSATDAFFDFNLQLTGIAVGTSISLTLSDLDWIGLDGEISGLLNVDGVGVSDFAFTSDSVTFSGISASPNLVRFSPNALVNFEIAAMAIPEPKSLSILTLGIGAVWLTRRKWHRSVRARVASTARHTGVGASAG